MAGGRIKGITVEIGGDTTKLTESLKAVDKEISTTSKNLKDVNRLLKMDPSNTTLLAQKQKDLSTSIEATKKRLDALKEASKQADQQLAEGKISTEQYDALQREITQTEQDLKSLEDEYKSFGSVSAQQIAQVGEKMKGVGEKISGVGEGLSKGVTAPIAAIGAASVASWKEVDDAMDTVEAKTGATGKNLEGLQNSVKSVATGMNTSFSDAGTAVGEVNTRFGVTGTKLTDLSTKFIKFAQLNGTDVNSSIDTVSAAMNAFGQDAGDAGDVLDAFNKVGQDTGLSVDKLGQLVQKNAGQMRSLGLNAQQSAGFLGMVEKSGLDTTVMMTGLTKAQKTCAADGKTLSQGLSEFSQVMTSNKSDTEKLQAAYDLFGSRAGGAIANAVSTGKLSLSDLGNSLTGFSGSVDATFEATQDPVDRFQQTLNKLKLVGADLVDTAGPMIVALAEKLAAVVGKVSVAWNSLSAGQQDFIVKAALVAAAVGPILVGVGKLVTGVGSILTFAPKIAGAISGVKTGLTALNAVMVANPIVLIIAAIAALVAAFIYLWNTSDGFRNFWINLWNEIKNIAISVGQAIASFFQTCWNGISTFFTTIWTGIKTIFTTAITAIQTIVTTIFTAISTFFTTIWTAIKTIFTTSVTTIKTVITTVFTAIATFFTTVWTSIKTAVTTIVNAMKNALTTAFNAMKTAITSVLNGIKAVFTTVWNGIKTAVTTIGNGIKTAATTAFNGMLNGIKSVCGRIAGVVRSGFSGAIGYIKGLAGQAVSWGRDIINGIVRGIQNMLGALRSAVSNVANTIRSFLHFSVPDEGPLTDYQKWMPDFMGGLTKGIEQSRGMVKSAMEHVASDMSIAPKMQVQAAMAGVGSVPVSAAADNGDMGAPQITIQQMTVRSDDDIRQISQELNTLMQRGRKAKGKL